MYEPPGHVTWWVRPNDSAAAVPRGAVGSRPAMVHGTRPCRPQAGVRVCSSRPFGVRGRICEPLGHVTRWLHGDTVGDGLCRWASSAAGPRGCRDLIRASRRRGSLFVRGVPLPSRVEFADPLVTLLVYRQAIVPQGPGVVGIRAARVLRVLPCLTCAWVWPRVRAAHRYAGGPCVRRAEYPVGQRLRGRVSGRVLSLPTVAKRVACLAVARWLASQFL